MPDSSARLALPYILPAQAQKHVTHNEAIERLDVLVQLTVEDFSATTPPAQPAEGAVWALGDTPGGDWAGQGGKLAARTNNGWLFITPQPGWRAALATDLRIWDGSAWISLAQTVPDSIAGLGINTSYDATNLLAVAADATLFTHDGNGHQLKLNKQAANDTATMLFQTDWSGRAEIGTVGNDQFQIKVSTDGTTWRTALETNAATGSVLLPNGAQCNGTLSGTAVAQSPADTTPGRLLTTQAGPAQAFCQANILGAVAQSGGVPSGALVERGTNSNGDYMRFADGTQICMASVGSNGTQSTTWTFPAAFAVAPSVAGAAVVGDPYTSPPALLTYGSISATSLQFAATRTDTNAKATVAARHLAIGRWV